MGWVNPGVKLRGKCTSGGVGIAGRWASGGVEQQKCVDKGVGMHRHG